MLCQRCNKNEATTIFTQNINGHTTTEHICSECAVKSGVNKIFNGFSLLGFDNLFDGFSKPTAIKTKQCKKCGATLYDIRKNGRMGCGECYKTFAQELEGTIQNIHGKAVHTGKKPNSLPIKEESNNISKLEELQNKLEAAVKEQNFEDAAKYRDQINELKNNDSQRK